MSISMWIWKQRGRIMKRLNTARERRWKIMNRIELHRDYPDDHLVLLIALDHGEMRQHAP